MIFDLNRFQISFGYNFCWIEWFSKFIFFMHMHMRNHDNMLAIYILRQKKSFANIDDVCLIGGKSHSTP
jgi:hypothetical protein